MLPIEIHIQTLMAFLAPIRALLEDADVVEIMINGPNEIFVERRGRLERTDARFGSEQALTAALRCIAQYASRPLDSHHPILEARTPDGSRVQAVMPPAAPHGPLVSIRRFLTGLLHPEQLLATGALDTQALRLLRDCVRERRDVIVAGGTGSGKTTLLNALSSFVPPNERVVVIEDSRELQLQGEHVVHLEAQPSDKRGRGAVSVRELFHATLRLRPDRIVIGEIRGGEALDLVQAMTSGHGGCMSTVHASTPTDALHRLETMALLGGVELPLFALRSQLASAVDLVVQTNRLADGSRKVTHICEVVDVCPERGYRLRDVLCPTRSSESDPSREELVWN